MLAIRHLSQHCFEKARKFIACSRRRSPVAMGRPASGSRMPGSRRPASRSRSTRSTWRAGPCWTRSVDRFGVGVHTSIPSRQPSAYPIDATDTGFCLRAHKIAKVHPWLSRPVILWSQFSIKNPSTKITTSSCACAQVNPMASVMGAQQFLSMGWPGQQAAAAGGWGGVPGWGNPGGVAMMGWPPGAGMAGMPPQQQPGGLNGLPNVQAGTPPLGQLPGGGIMPGFQPGGLGQMPHQGLQAPFHAAGRRRACS